jgi:ankyrin repeat protein
MSITMKKLSLIFLASIGIYTIGYGMKQPDRPEGLDEQVGAVKKAKKEAQKQVESIKKKFRNALKNGDTTTLAKLLSSGQLDDVTWQGGDTHLHRVAEVGRPVCVQPLVDAGADVNATNIHGQTPLHVASSGCIPPLLAAQADINAQDNQDLTPLHYACFRGSERVKALVEAQANVNASGSGPLRNKKAVASNDLFEETSCLTPLHIAAGGQEYGYDVDSLRLLIEAGARIDAVASTGRKHQAMSVIDCVFTREKFGYSFNDDGCRGQRECVRLLLDAHLQSNADMTALELADTRLEIPHTHVSLFESVAAVPLKKKESWYKNISHEVWKLLFGQIDKLVVLAGLSKLQKAERHREWRCELMQELFASYLALTTEQRKILLKAFSDLGIAVPEPILILLRIEQDVERQIVEPDVRRMVLEELGNVANDSQPLAEYIKETQDSRYFIF